MSRSQRNRRRRRGRGRSRNKALLATAVVLVMAALAGLSAVGYVVSIASSAPPLSSLKARDAGSISVVYARNGERLGVIQNDELRKWVSAARIPKVLEDATVAIEDERFYRHKGVDYEGVIRAAIKNLSSRKTVQGGSTITMQLIRALYIDNPERTYERKIREAKLAEELENKHPGDRGKRWILNEYINTVPYGTVGGQSAIGAWAAAKMYFDKPVEKLELHEAALLAGLPQAPSTYSPTRSQGAALARRNEVLRKMADLGMVSEAEAREAIGRDLGLNLSRYFQERRESYFFDFVKDQLLENLKPSEVRKGGLRIHTTLDLKKQRYARETINANLDGVGPSSALVTLDPANGHILAMASSADYGKSKFNLAAQGHRQPGSAFKVMALMTALERGIDPNTTYYNGRSPIRIDDPVYGKFEIKNYGNGQFSGNLYQATLRSVNAVYIQLAMDLGPQAVKQTAYDMGIESKLEGYPAETLGGLKQGVSPLEMARANATIANGGWRRRPIAITKVVRRSGEVLEGSTLPSKLRPNSVKVFKDGVTAKATEILQANIKGGTGGRAEIGCPAGGKTGTTDENSDAWFVGFTPRLATAVWVGYPNARIFMRSEFNGGPVDGGTFPAKIWGEYMKKAKGGYCGDFPKPKEPMTFTKFFGKYARTAKPVPSVGPSGPPDGGGTETRGKGKGKGKQEFDPTLYESAPQEAPVITPAPPAPTQAPPEAGGAPPAAAPTP